MVFWKASEAPRDSSGRLTKFSMNFFTAASSTATSPPPPCNHLSLTAERERRREKTREKRRKTYLVQSVPLEILEFGSLQPGGLHDGLGEVGQLGHVDSKTLVTCPLLHLSKHFVRMEEEQ